MMLLDSCMQFLDDLSDVRVRTERGTLVSVISTLGKLVFIDSMGREIWTTRLDK